MPLSVHDSPPTAHPLSSTATMPAPAQSASVGQRHRRRRGRTLTRMFLPCLAATLGPWWILRTGGAAMLAPTRQARLFRRPRRREARVERQAAVDEDRLAGDVGRLVAGQEA